MLTKAVGGSQALSRHLPLPISGLFYARRTSRIVIKL